MLVLGTVKQWKCIVIVLYAGISLDSIAIWIVLYNFSLGSRFYEWNFSTSIVWHQCYGGSHLSLDGGCGIYTNCKGMIRTNSVESLFSMAEDGLFWVITTWEDIIRHVSAAYHPYSNAWDGSRRNDKKAYCDSFFFVFNNTSKRHQLCRIKVICDLI